MEKKFHVRDGDIICCSLGSSLGQIRVPLSRGARIGEKNEATIMDCIPGVNITSFGTCQKMDPPQPCTPAVINAWLLGNKNHTIGKSPALLSTSILSCTCGGIIRIRQQY